jgi:hypothetical protein
MVYPRSILVRSAFRIPPLLIRASFEQGIVQAAMQFRREREAGGKEQRESQQDDGQQHEDQAQHEQEGLVLRLFDQTRGACDGLLDRWDVSGPADRVRDGKDRQRRTELADEGDQRGIDTFPALAACSSSTSGMSGKMA